MNVKEIAALADIMSKHKLTEFSIEEGDTKLVIRRECGELHPQPVGPATMAIPTPVATAPVATAPTPVTPEPTPADTAETPAIRSPLVGTFYAAPAPDKPTFVKVGDEVNEETVVCIVEAMKVMNEITAEASGRIKRVLVENAQPVEYGQALFEIEPL